MVLSSPNFIFTSRGDSAGSWKAPLASCEGLNPPEPWMKGTRRRQSRSVSNTRIKSRHKGVGRGKKWMQATGLSSSDWGRAQLSQLFLFCFKSCQKTLGDILHALVLRKACAPVDIRKLFVSDSYTLCCDTVAHSYCHTAIAPGEQKKVQVIFNMQAIKLIKRNQQTQL